MRTIQMTIDDRLLDDVDQAVRKMGTSRSEFIREALSSALRRQRLAEMERLHAEGYARTPAREDEFDGWIEEQAWPDA